MPRLYQRGERADKAAALPTVRRRVTRRAPRAGVGASAVEVCVCQQCDYAGTRDLIILLIIPPLPRAL